MAVIWKHVSLRKCNVVVGSEQYSLGTDGVLSPEVSEHASAILMKIPGYTASQAPVKEAAPAAIAAPTKPAAKKKAAPKKKAAKPKKS